MDIRHAIQVYHPGVPSFIFLLQLSQLWPPGAPSGCFLHSFNNPILFKHILIIWFHKTSRLRLYFSCPSSGTNRFCKDP